jgi:hypothetical protein
MAQKMALTASSRKREAEEEPSEPVIQKIFDEPPEPCISKIID